MRLVWLLVRRDLRQAWISAGLWLPVAFLLLVASLYPFAVGPDARLLARTGGGMLWIAALLASLLPVDRLIAPDAQAGVLDQMAARGIGEEMIVLARLVAHWIGFGPPLMLAALPAAALLKLDSAMLVRLEIGLLIGTPALAALGLLVATLTAGLRSSGALAGLLALPLAVPLLIFGAGTLGDGSGAALKFLAAASLLLVAITPFAGGAALRAGRE
ncbi:heme exporter protein CcmB [Sphingobium sp. 10 DY56-G10]|uniref:Heme exporter protein B n=1 Tax=Sphingobium soli TaxID=1591116 RepID=A0ABS8GYP4_9SPHN|nr:MULTISPECIES: heme exporter protein CcmB [Sphingomonadaceae]EAT08352.1 cytochrome c-type biogenesis protein CcmB [Sphingomonas sp. SKA58]MCC4231334.1 heme exporter protein CcmB [Sphingobium soli]